MTDDFEGQPSNEELVEAFRARAAVASDFAVDEQLAVADARWRVAARYGYGRSADLWHDVVLALDDVRRERAALREAVEDAMFQTVDLGEIADDDE